MAIPHLVTGALPDGRYAATMAELEQQFVDDQQYTSSSTRRSIWADWTAAVTLLPGTLASAALSTEIDLNLGLRTPTGRRQTAVLRARGAHAIQDAVDRNRERETVETVSGKLRTVSDGADKVRIELPDKTIIRATVGRELGLNLGPWLGELIEAEIETTIRWNLTTGRERKSYKLIDAQRIDNTAPPVLGDP